MTMKQSGFTYMGEAQGSFSSTTSSRNSQVAPAHIRNDSRHQHQQQRFPYDGRIIIRGWPTSPPTITPSSLNGRFLTTTSGANTISILNRVLNIVDEAIEKTSDLHYDCDADDGDAEADDPDAKM